MYIYIPTDERTNTARIVSLVMRREFDMDGWFLDPYCM
jgi:hypothetical protein